MVWKKRGLIPVVLGIFILVFSLFVTAQSTGCYTYPGAGSGLRCVDDVLEDAVINDCASNEDCVLTQYFNEGVSCAELEECQIVTCDVDCQDHTLLECLSLGGSEVPLDQFDQVCTPGCCVLPLSAGQNQCQFPLLKGACEELAFQEGLEAPGFYAGPGMTQELCATQFCPETSSDSLQKVDVIVRVVDENAAPVLGAVVNLGGALGEEIGEGVYGFYDVLASTYVVTVTASELPPTSKSINVGPVDPAEVEIVLFALDEQELAEEEDQQTGIMVTASLNGEKQHDVAVYVDGVFRGKTLWPQGSLFVPMSVAEESEEHSVFIAYQGLQSQKNFVELFQGEVTDVFLELFEVTSECSFGEESAQKDVELFSVEHVLGKRQVALSWAKPCSKVTGFVLEREGAISGGVKLFTFFGTETSMVDDDVEWGKTYLYRIKATYSDIEQRESLNWNEVQITLGDELCELHYNEELGYGSFCNPQDKTSVYTCTEQNMVSALTDCSGLGAQSTCAPAGENVATCKEITACSFGSPFGLFSSSEQCYGVLDPTQEVALNYCYYDSTNTISDQCLSCASVESCFEYKSKDACVANGCLSEQCEWVESAAEQPLVDYSILYQDYEPNALYTTPETGAGYCVTKEYDKADKCSLCGPNSPPSALFENAFCTAEVCSALGSCFSEQSLEECQSCPTEPQVGFTCYDYATAQECEGAGSTQIDELGHVITSSDSCSWGRCSWVGSPSGAGACIKDGDGNKVDDCLGPFTSGSSELCRVDITPPRTSLTGATLKISLENPEIVFVGSDLHENPLQQSALSELYYCITSAQIDSCLLDEFVPVKYNGQGAQEEILVNIIESPFLDSSIEGQPLILKYFSKDIYHNQEDVQEEYIQVDTILPSFLLVEEVLVQDTFASLTVHIEEASEPMSCVFVLDPIIGNDEVQSVSTSIEEPLKIAAFSKLNGARYDLTVTCADDFGNTQSEVKTYVFNFNPDISIVSPKLGEPLASNEIIFSVETPVPSTCDLYDASTGGWVINFLTNEAGIAHSTPLLSGFEEGEYAASHRVECTNQQSGEISDAYFHFSVDLTPPETIVNLYEESTILSPSSQNWKESFIKEAVVELVCDAGISGFACENTFYCLGDACKNPTPTDFVEYESPFLITQTTDLCYFSTDIAGSPFPKITCGTIVIDGIGVLLVNPEGYMFENELWGVSSTSEFDWTFLTKLATDQCKFDFTPEFDFISLAPFKQVPKIGNAYVYEQFPGEIISPFPQEGGVKQLYVQCDDGEQVLDLETKINLEYDPTPPQILGVEVEPNPLIEGTSVLVTVETDDKSVCKYSDITQTGGATFESMEYTLGPDEENELFVEHEGLFAISYLGAMKEFVLAVQCMNGAGEFSEVEEVSFLVDYTALGNILTTSPKGFTAASEVMLQVETSKKGFCEYKMDGEYTAFTTTNSNMHSSFVTTLEEKEYTFPVRCTMEDHTVFGEISFTVDKTAPKILKVDAGKYLCGAQEDLSVMVSSNEEALASYFYEVFEGKSSFDITTLSTPLLSNTLSAAQGLSIPSDDLEENKSYIIRVTITDEAGNIGSPKTSSSVSVVSENHSACLNDDDAPLVLVESFTDPSCSFAASSMSAALVCDDDLGCKITYGVAQTQDLCEPVHSYYGENIPITQDIWVCYVAQDSKGQNVTESVLFQFPDEDGDGVQDSCDVCPNTHDGKIVESNGCADGQFLDDDVTLDGDHDGLPDIFEKVYGGFDCDLSPNSVDTNGNGILDGDEDYDNDGFTNYEEFLASTNPCDASDMLLEQEDEFEETSSVIDSSSKQPTPTKENNTLAIALLIIGLVMVIGGVGYLIYYYKSSSKKEGGIAGDKAALNRQVKIPQQKSKPLFPRLSSALGNLRRKKSQAAKRSVFAEFSKSSEEIPHIKDALRKRGDAHTRLGHVANTYVEHKSEIAPGLQSHEKGVFAHLEDIARTSKKKDLRDVVSESEASDIFTRLKDISKSRKKKEKK